MARDVTIDRQNLIYGYKPLIDPNDLWTASLGIPGIPPGSPPPLTPDQPWFWGADFQKMPDTLSGKPFPIWAQGEANGLISHYHVDQMRWLEVTAILNRDDELDIDLIDDDGVPILDPAVPPLAVLRGAINTTQTGNDWIDDKTIGTWSDSWVNMPTREGAPTNNAYSYRLRLNRSPVPHWRLTLTSSRTETSSSGTTYRFGFRVGMLGNYSGPHTDYTLTGGSLTSWAVGRYAIDTVWQNAGNDVESLDVMNGSDVKWERSLMARGAIDIASLGNSTIYPRWPSGLSTDSQIFASTRMPLCRVLADPTTTLATHGTETTWKPGSLGLGASTAANPPFDPANQPNYGFYSELSWDGANSAWRTRIYNRHPTSSKSFYVWWIGV